MARRKSLPEYQITNVRLLDDLPSQPAQTIPIEQIKLPAKQPRRYFDPEKLQQLIQSIQEHGILEPLLVRPLSSNQYELVAGERRLRAAQQLKLPEVPIISKNFTDQEALQVSLIENLQREDLNPIEETEAVLELLAIDLNVDSDEVVSLLNQAANAKRRGQSLTDNIIRQISRIESTLATLGRFSAESFRANRIPLLNLPEDVLTSLRQGQLEFTKARAISRVKDEGQRKKLLQKAISENLSLSEIKAKIQEIKPEVQAVPERVMTERLVEISKRLRKSETWGDRKKKDRITKLLDELDKLTASND